MIFDMAVKMGDKIPGIGAMFSYAFFDKNEKLLNFSTKQFCFGHMQDSLPDGVEKAEYLLFYHQNYCTCEINQPFLRWLISRSRYANYYPVKFPIEYVNRVGVVSPHLGTAEDCIAAGMILRSEISYSSLGAQWEYIQRRIPQIDPHLALIVAAHFNSSGKRDRRNAFGSNEEMEGRLLYFVSDHAPVPAMFITKDGYLKIPYGLSKWINKAVGTDSLLEKWRYDNRIFPNHSWCEGQLKPFRGNLSSFLNEYGGALIELSKQEG